MQRRIKSGLYLLLLIAATNTVQAQSVQEMAEIPEPQVREAPDYDRIARETADPSSAYYYPRLFDRYERGDTTLTLDDYRHLYYGYPEQPNYRPLLPSAYTDSLDRAFKGKTAPTADDYRRMVYFARKVLEEQPFSLRDLNVLAFAYHMLDDPELAARQTAKMQGVVRAILSTGTGLEEKSPWYITYMRDAEDLLALQNARFTRMIIMTRTVGFVPVSNMRQKSRKGYYFDYSEVYKRRPDYLDEARGRRKLEVNPLRNPNSPLNLPR